VTHNRKVIRAWQVVESKEIRHNANAGTIPTRSSLIEPIHGYGPSWDPEECTRDEMLGTSEVVLHWSIWSNKEKMFICEWIIRHRFLDLR